MPLPFQAGLVKLEPRPWWAGVKTQEEKRRGQGEHGYLWGAHFSSLFPHLQVCKF